MIFFVGKRSKKFDSKKKRRHSRIVLQTMTSTRCKSTPTNLCSSIFTLNRTVIADEINEKSQRHKANVEQQMSNNKRMRYTALVSAIHDSSRAAAAASVPRSTPQRAASVASTAGSSSVISANPRIRQQWPKICKCQTCCRVNTEGVNLNQSAWYVHQDAVRAGQLQHNQQTAGNGRQSTRSLLACCFSLQLAPLLSQLQAAPDVDRR